MVDTHRIYEWIAHPDTLDRDSLRELRALVERYPYFQTARILYLRNLVALQDPDLPGELHRQSAYITDRKQLFHLIEDGKVRTAVPPDETVAADTTSPDRTLELIDAFLQGEMGKVEKADDDAETAEVEIPEPETGNTTPEVAEEDSDESYFTETLAKIYVKQQRYSKALEIIKKLYLKYPKKNVYFADQIRFLEKLIINNKQK
jgi:tetratricopeptide (TPR) repeat protein